MQEHIWLTRLILEEGCVGGGAEGPSPHNVHPALFEVSHSDFFIVENSANAARCKFRSEVLGRPCHLVVKAVVPVLLSVPPARMSFRCPGRRA